MDLNFEPLEPILGELWTIIENWSLVICIAGVAYLAFAAWTHKPGKIIKASITLMVGILGAFL
ncbi:MAG: hypothetical protein RBR05_00875 [Candidatus Methanomethylophilaceae archaeon]|nr:hypothetical protein [Candidatus Methanomethylophilaceae archaeon]